MSLVVFPFKQEDLSVVSANLTIGARHQRVDEVWAVAAAEGDSLAEVSDAARDIAAAEGATIRVFPQERLGVLRPGKGDGMNTAIRAAAERGFDRVHFYDADITNFGDHWIDGAERAADRGYQVVRHRFPRASTDAMITWMITRPLLAKSFPGTILPRLGQPLGGELLLTGEAVTAMAGDELVRNRSDWGIDTVLTYASTALGLPMFEHNLAEGKRHALYGTLDEIKVMALECLDAAIQLGTRPAPIGTEFGSDPAQPVPDDLKHTVAYDVNPTMGLLTSGWTPAEEALAADLPGTIAPGVLANRSEPTFDFMSEEVWGATLDALIPSFRLGDPVSQSLAFRWWLIRVLAYTTNQALEGYDSAISYLERTIRDYEKLADHHD